MTDDREVLERVARSFPPDAGIVERVYRRRDRKRRNQRIVAATLALVLAGVGIGGLLVTFGRSDSLPADRERIGRRVSITRYSVEGFTLMSLEGQDLGPVPGLPRGARDVSVSRDGRMIAFSDDGAIYAIGVDGSGLRKIAEPRHYLATAPSWSPDGSRIAFWGGAGAHLVTVRADGTDLQRLGFGTLSGGPSVAYPRWSPDGQEIVLGEVTSGSVPWTVGVHVVDLTSHIDTLLAGGTVLAGGTDVNAWGADWSPDGSLIAFSRGDTARDFDLGRADPAYDIWVMDADGSDQRPLVSNESGAEVGPFWSPDGTMIAYTSVAETHSVWVVDVATGSARRVGSGRVFGWMNAGTLVVGGSS
jgi:dipeptidyl aminopeptidase/acylaminoacyl peptidase